MQFNFFKSFYLGHHRHHDADELPASVGSVVQRDRNHLHHLLLQPDLHRRRRPHLHHVLLPPEVLRHDRKTGLIRIILISIQILNCLWTHQNQ